MKRAIPFLLILVLLTSPNFAAAQVESDPLVISLGKDFGYAAGGKIQGSFSLKVRSPDDLVRVDYLIDNVLVHTATEPPFRFQFNTADFSAGEHSFKAVGYRENGAQIVSSEFTREFIDAKQAWDSVGKLIVPLFVVVGGVSLLAALGSVNFGRKRDFKLGEYGLAGGVVCPRCQLPYARNVLAPNLVIGKLSRCPHCGKWAVLPRASQIALKAAEDRFAVKGVIDLEALDDDKDYRRLLDDSRFED